MTGSNYWGTENSGRLSRRRLIGATAAGGVVLLGCGGRKAAAPAAGSGAQPAQAVAPKAGGTLNVYLPYNPTLDPQKSSAAAQQAVGGSYSRLLAFKTSTDPVTITDHVVENDLAVSVESPDALTWTVKLRPDAKFQNLPPVNGHAVEAEDVKASFLRALDPATGNPNRGALGMIDPAQIQTPDARTVVFKLAYTYAPFRQTLASPTYSQILPREAGGGFDPSKTVIGSGPFIVDTTTPDVAYTYKRNPDWYQKGMPYVDTVKVAIIADRAQQIAQFTAGNLDELILDSPDDLAAVQQQAPKAQVLKVLYASPFPFYFQMGADEGSPFLDIRLRQAVSMAVDRDALSKVIYSGQGDQIVYVPAYMGRWAMKVSDLPASSRQYYKFNPSQAKQLLQAAGANNLQVVLVYITMGPGIFAPTPAYKNQVETVANMLNQVGIKTTIATNDYNKDFIDAGKGSRQGYFDKNTIMFVNLGNFSDADEWLFSYFHSKSLSNQEHLSDPAYDAMVDKQRTLVNDDDRLKAVQDIHKYLADKAYAPSTVGTYQWNLVLPRVLNYQYSNSSGKMTETYAKCGVQD
jgi:peptide/nickel transport system substrate-binding protein